MVTLTGRTVLRRRARVRRAVSTLGLLGAGGLAIGWSLGAPPAEGSAR